ALNRGIPERHDAVADELVDGSAFFRDRGGNLLEIGRDLRQQIVRRQGFGVRGKILQVGKEYREESRLDAKVQRNARLDELTDDVERHERRELFQRGAKQSSRVFQPR